MPTNLPEKSSGVGVECSQREGDSGSYHVFTSDGWTIEYVNSARDIARLVEWARDQGYRHAMKDVRRLIGVKE